MSYKDSGPAFPCSATHDLDGNEHGFRGMSLRDYFAAAALKGFCASMPPEGRNNMADGVLGGAKLAAASFVAADAMLKEREK